MSEHIGLLEYNSNYSLKKGAVIPISKIDRSGRPLRPAIRPNGTTACGRPELSVRSRPGNARVSKREVDRQIWRPNAREGSLFMVN